MPTSPISRRSFLRQFNCAAVSSSAILNTLLNLKLANSAAADGIIGSGTDSKALVCLFLSGGIDSFQMMVPWEQSRYDSYATTRGAFGSPGGLALQRSTLLQMNGAAADFALHPSLAGLHQMATGTGAFAGKKRVAAITNVGTLVQPITKSEYQAWEDGSNAALPVPRALFSHSDQMEQWQTGVPQGMIELSGWAGRAADLLTSAYNTSATSMSISLSGCSKLARTPPSSSSLLVAHSVLKTIAPPNKSRTKPSALRLARPTRTSSPKALPISPSKVMKPSCSSSSSSTQPLVI
jgi:uncharacterized protein (DUF1501 family)